MEHIDLPKYRRVKEMLRDRILSGRITPGTQLPTEVELLSEFGVSRHTIRQAVGELVSEGLLERKQGSGTYVRAITASGRLPAPLVGVVITYISEYIFPSILRGIERSLKARGFGVVLASTENEREREPECLEAMLRHNVSGLIVEPAQSALPGPDLRPYRHLAARGIPLVMINGTYPVLGVPAVTVDDFLGTFRVVSHLIELGHKDLAIITKSDDVQGVERERGALAALHENGLSIAPEHVCHYTTHERATRPGEFVQQVLAGPRPPTAIACYNDQIALQVLTAARAVGLRVPEDLSVAGFDNSPLLHSAHVPLTSVTHPQEELGRQAADLLCELIGNPVQGSRRTVQFQPDLVIRSSTGPLRHSHVAPRRGRQGPA